MSEEEADQIRRRIRDATPALRQFIACELGRLEARLSLARAVLDEKARLTIEEAASATYESLAARLGELAGIGLLDCELDAYRDGYRQAVLLAGRSSQATPHPAPETPESG